MTCIINRDDEAYGDKYVVKGMLGIDTGDDASDDEVDQILAQVSDFIDDALAGVPSVPLDYVPKKRKVMLGHIANILAHGEYEMRRRNCDTGIARSNYGWLLLDRFIALRRSGSRST